MKNLRTMTPALLLLAITLPAGVALTVPAVAATPPMYVDMYFDPAGVAPLYPSGGTADAEGTRYIADSGGDRIVRIDASGVQSVVNDVGWHRPRDLVLDSDPTKLWVADTTDNQIVQLSTSGTVLKTFQGGTAYTKSAFGISADSTGVYVADTYNSRVFKISKTDGAKLWTQTTCNGAFGRPRDVTVGSDGNVYVADTDHNRIAVLNPSTGACVRSFGSGGAGPGQFRAPRSIASDGDGGLWVAEAQAPRLQHVTNAGVSLGTVGSVGTGPGKFRAPACVFVDGPYVDVCDTYEYVIQRFSVSATGVPMYLDSLGGVRPVVPGFNQPFGVAYGPNGELYVTDMFNHRIQKRNPDGSWIAWGGFGTRAGSFQFPRGIAVSPDGNTVVVTNSENNRLDLFTPTGTLIRSVRPSGLSFGWPHQTALAPDGTFWVADTNANRVLHLSSTGSVLLNFNNGGQLKTPRGIALDAAGNVYVSNSGNNTVQKFSASGTFLATVATAGSGPGQVKQPWNLDVTGIPGNESVWITDGLNHRIVVVSTAGDPQFTFGTKGSGPGQFDSPRGVSVDPVTGSVAVTDFNNNRVLLWASS